MERTFDAELVRSIVAGDRATYYLSSDDGCPALEDFDATYSVANKSEFYFMIAIKDEKVIGLFFFRKNNYIMVDVHVAIVEKYRGKDAVLAAKIAFNMIFCYGFRKIQAYVPSFNLPAYYFAKMTGMMDEGKSKGSFMKDGILHDQFILGISEV